jgi:hypothetical protein
VSESDNIATAQEVHHKFEFYLVALTFTIAGFAIQTGKFSGNWFSDLSEGISWVILFSSGAIGLKRLQYFPVIYRTYDGIQTRKQLIKICKDNEKSPDLVSEWEKEVNEYAPKLEAIETGNLKSASWQNISFAVGLGALLIARITSQLGEHYW